MSSLFTLTSFILVGKDLWRNGVNFPALKHWYICLLIAFWSNLVHKLMLLHKQLQRHHMNRFRSDAIVKNDIHHVHTCLSTSITPCWQAIGAFTIIRRESYKYFNLILGLEIRWFRPGFIFVPRQADGPQARLRVHSPVGQGEGLNCWRWW
jgi:hypothetical protein